MGISFLEGRVSSIVGNINGTDILISKVIDWNGNVLYQSRTENLLCLTAEDDGCSIMFEYVSGDGVSYRKSGEDWNDCPSGTQIILYERGDSVQLSGQGIRTDSYSHFMINGKVRASGSVTSLTDGKGFDSDVELQDNCYEYMFLNCPLVTPPELPATTLSNSCYNHMFSGCVELIETPELPSASLADTCYFQMFSECTSLTSPSFGLSAETLKTDCYTQMFDGCSALTATPLIMAKNLPECSMMQMFANCGSLENAHFPNLSSTVVKNKLESSELTFENSADNINAVCSDRTVRVNDTYGNYLTFTCEEAGSTIKFYSTNSTAIKIRKNLGEWEDYSDGSAITLENVGDTVQFKAKTTDGGVGVFELGGLVGASGDVTSMVNEIGGDADLTDVSMENMFRQCYSLTTPPNLPSTTISVACYHSMFARCSNLLTIPEIAAVNIYGHSMNLMFANCPKLTGVLTLNASNIVSANYCYFYIVTGSTGVTKVRMRSGCGYDSGKNGQLSSTHTVEIEYF